MESKCTRLCRHSDRLLLNCIITPYRKVDWTGSLSPPPLEKCHQCSRLCSPLRDADSHRIWGTSCHFAALASFGLNTQKCFCWHVLLRWLKMEVQAFGHDDLVETLDLRLYHLLFFHEACLLDSVKQHVFIIISHWFSTCWIYLVETRNLM